MPLAFVFTLFTFFSSLFLTFILPGWTTHIVGALQDTRLFLWNLWWFKDALDAGRSPYFTPMLFHPFGVSLISHEFPLWNNLLGYAAQKAGATIPLAANLTMLVTWALNGFCVFGLAREILLRPPHPPPLPVGEGGRSPGEGRVSWLALPAGLYAMTHSYALARMMQNWGQFNFFSIALYLWALLRARRVSSTRSWIAAGAGFAFTAACHYYFFIYAFVITAALLAADDCPWRLQVAGSRTSRPAWRITTLCIAGLAAGIAAWIVRAAPGALEVAGAHISLTTPVNALLVMWISLGLYAFSWMSVTIVKRPAGRLQIRPLLISGGTALLLLSPLIAGAIGTILRGDYPRQSILWKTHPLGANLFTPVMPNPLQALWGPAITRHFAAWQWHPQEQAAMIGWVLLAAFAASGLWRETGSPRRWLALASGSTILSLGVYLHLGSLNTWLPAPFYAARLLPLVGNVRIPERWMAVGAIAWGVVLALALARMAQSRRWPPWKVGLVVSALILAENWPGLPAAPPPPSHPAYQALRQLPPGGVLALPFYAGDSSIGAGGAASTQEWIFPWDQLWAQTMHQKPIAGGYIGRIPRRLIKAYKNDIFFNTIINLEENPSLAASSLSSSPRKLPVALSVPVTNEQYNASAGTGTDSGCRAASRFGFEYVLVFREAMPGTSWSYVTANLPLERLVAGPGPELYRVNKFTCQNRLAMSRKARAA